jgi:O-antigen/teichoic acid export membrane protein
MLITGQLKKNTIWSMLDLGIYPVMMILATPVFIKHLGYEQYGVWMMVSTINQFMYVLNFGLGDSTIKIISVNRAFENTSLIAAGINRNWSQALLISLISVILGIAVSWSGMIEYWFHIPEHLIDSTRLVLILAFISTGVKFCEMVLLSILKGYERFDISAQMSLVSKNTVVLASVFLALYGYPLYIIFSATVMINVANILAQLIVIKKRLPFLNFMPSSIKGKTIAGKDQFWYWLQSVIGLIGFLSDRIVVGYFTNLKILGLYSLASLIGSQIHNALTALGAFMFPKVAYEHSLKKDTLQMYYNSRFVINGSGWLIILVLTVSGDLIFKLWLGEEKFNHSIGYINLYLGYIAFLLLTIIPYQFINASHQPFYNSVFEGVLRTCHLIAMPLGFYWFGISGLLWGLICSTGLIMIVQYYFFHKHFFNIVSLPASLKVVVPSLCFIPFMLHDELWLKITACVFLALSIYLFYYKPTSFKPGNT